MPASFKIDDPLDPTNKYLYHSFVESPDMMNIYNGNAVLNKKGEAVIELPKWFQALNKDFRYQLTCIGGSAPVYIAEEIKDNHFKIAGGKPGVKGLLAGHRRPPGCLCQRPSHSCGRGKIGSGARPLLLPGALWPAARKALDGQLFSPGEGNCANRAAHSGAE